MAATYLYFDVGVTERHRVVFSFDKFIGRLVITVDGTRVTDKLQLFSVKLVSRYRFTVGEEEQHDVIIEKHRARFLAFARPQPCRAYVDGQLVAEATA